MGRHRDEIIPTFELMIVKDTQWLHVVYCTISIMKTKQKTLNLVIFIIPAVCPFLTGFWTCFNFGLNQSVSQAFLRILPFMLSFPFPCISFSFPVYWIIILQKNQNLAFFPRKQNKKVSLLFLNSFLHLLPSYCLLYVSQNSGRRGGNMNSLLGAFPTGLQW